MSDLATKMVVSAANVTRVAQSLAAKGLVVRERAQHSEREVLARLTPEGQKVFERHFPKATAFMSGLMDERLTMAEQRKLSRHGSWRNWLAEATGGDEFTGAPRVTDTATNATRTGSY